MTKNLQVRFLVILGVILASLFFSYPLEERINLGLDLKGGMRLVLRVETEKLDENAKSDAVERALEILRNRIDSLGVAEPEIQRQGDNGIIIQLPGITDRDRAIDVIGQVAQLEFKLVESDPVKVKDALSGTVPEGYVLKTVKKEEKEEVLLKNDGGLSGEHIADARVDFESQTGIGQPKISISFDSIGKREFGTLTQEHVGERLAIVLDGEVLSAPTIQEAILTGTGQITGMFTFEEASLLALALRSGALPAPMKIEEERTTGPTLGRDSIDAGIKATIIGGALVLAFMLLYYGVGGIIADFALMINILLIIGAMGFLNFMMPDAQVTLTLPGIAGIILTMGMAVDANVLINERIREELSNERPLKAAINSGFDRAFKAILDSNLTTLIAAFMLFQFGSGPIKGFAVTLSIGLMASLFTALFITRTLFQTLTEWGIIKKLSMMRLLANTNINFINIRVICFSLSILLVAGSFYTWHKKGETAYGIDFAGGQIQEYKFKEAVNADDLRKILKEGGVENIIIQQLKEEPRNVIIKSAEDTYDNVVPVLKDKMANNPFEILRIEKVGPVVGQILRKRAILAMIFALLGILVFVGFRFKHFDFATAGVIAVLHDVIVTLGILLMLNRQIDLLVITALLTIAGYSINDTIVIYDRVRENIGKAKKMKLKDLINLSVNQTLGRTILTTITTLLVVFSLYYKGGEILNTFALCLIIGFISGTYSTIFIASPLVLAFQKKPKK